MARREHHNVSTGTSTAHIPIMQHLVPPLSNPNQQLNKRRENQSKYYIIILYLYIKCVCEPILYRKKPGLIPCVGFDGW